MAPSLCPCRNSAQVSLTSHRVKNGDDFVANLWDVHLRVKEGGYAHTLSLGLFRSDYMVHEDAGLLQVKQVEFNTIASSFGGLSSQTTQLHQFLAATEYPLLEKPLEGLGVEESKSVELLANGLATAFEVYDQPSGPGFGRRPKWPRCILFVVQDAERNVFDQTHLQYQLAKHNPPIPVFRLPFSGILAHTRVEEESRQLLYTIPRTSSWPTQKTYEVAAVYFRSGYDPSDYPTQESWDARYQLERSAAIKCPTVLTQLAGMKKVQQVLATPQSASAPSILSRFLPDGDPSDLAALSETFTNIYPMDNSATGLEARTMAQDPERCQAFVLKPQREGGGNNIYKGAIPGFLKSVPPSHWGSYILMELIKPPPARNIILRNGKLEEGGVISELGIYGTCIWGNKEILHNEEAGYLLRTKGDKSEEGGVAAGYGCMDSVTLV